MNIKKVDSSNQHIYMNLAQAYEAEFSKIMNKKPDENGLFALDTPLGGNVTGYLLYIDGVPAGHTAIAFEDGDTYEVCDFYVAPYFRKNKAGKKFITALFSLLQGRWEIKQVEGAEHAVKFWRDVVGSYTEGNYVEDEYNDQAWGVVTRQCFCHQDMMNKMSA